MRMNAGGEFSNPRLWVGLLLAAVFWPLNWMLPGVRTAYLFFPLWLGYILIIDSLVQMRTGTSIWGRSRTQFVGLFILSAPAWWLFEWINKRTQNWEYVGSDVFSTFEYYVLCTISFSTVMPAVFETAELVWSFRWLDGFKLRIRVRSTQSVFVVSLLSGVAMLGLVLLWPKYFYPFVWGSLVFILEPLNRWAGRPHLMQHLRHGDWRIVVSLSVGALICGFFWEMWNFYSFPKWIYHTPGVEFAYMFEMPLLGYIGYIPFALELYELRSFVWSRSPRFVFENETTSP